MPEVPPPGLYTDDNPFKFLAYYEEADRDVFGGRDDEVREAVARITCHPTFVLYGAGGVGKTSFVLAGLFPALRAKGFYPVHVRTLQSPRGDLASALATAPARADDQSSPPAGADNVVVAIDKLEDRADDQPSPPAGAGLPLVLVFDQFEEFFLRFSADDRAELSRELARLAGQQESRVRFVFSLREDYLASLSEFQALFPDLFSNQCRLGPLTAFGAREAVEKLLLRDHVPYDRALLLRLIDTLAHKAGPEGGCDPPLLQILCAELYHEARQRVGSAPEPPRLTVDDLRRLGGVDGVFGRFLDRAFSNLPADAPTQLLVRLVVEALITEKRTKRAVTVDELLHGRFRATEGEVRGVLDCLVRQRLLREDTRLGKAWYELIHERLVDFLVPWLEADPTFVRLRGARQTIENATAVGLWREQLGLLLSSAALTETVGPFKDRLRLNDEALEFLFWSTLFQRHPDCGFWAEAFGLGHARGVVRNLLTSSTPVEGGREGGRANRDALRSGAAWACGHLPLKHDLSGVLRKIALDPSSPPELRRAAGTAYARTCTEDERAALPRRLGVESLRQWLGHLRAALAHRARQAGDWFGSLVPRKAWSWQRTPRPRAPEGAAEGDEAGPGQGQGARREDRDVRMELLADFAAAERLPANLPLPFRREARRRAQQRVFQDQEDLIRDRAAVGRVTGFRAGIGWALTVGVVFSMVVGWVLGKYGNASLAFMVTCTGVVLPLAMGLGAVLGHFAADAGARHALLRGEGRWLPVVLGSRALLAIFFLCFVAVAVAVGVLAFEAEAEGPPAPFWAAALLVPLAFLLLWVALAGMTGLARALVRGSTRAQTAAWAAAASLGPPHLVASLLYLPVLWVLGPYSAWYAATLAGVLLSFALFVLILALARAERKHPAGAPPAPRVPAWAARWASVALVALTFVLFLHSYGLDTVPFLRDHDLEGGELPPFRGQNAGLFDSDVYPLTTGKTVLVECARSGSKSARFFLDEEQAYFDREDRQFFVIPKGRHYAVVRGSSPGPYQVQLSKRAGPEGGPLLPGAERFAWCVCSREPGEADRAGAGGKWSGSVTLKVPDGARAKAPILAVFVGRAFFGFPRGGPGTVESGWAKEEVDYLNLASAIGRPANQNWSLQLFPDAGAPPAHGPDAATYLERVEAAVRIDFPALEKPVALFHLPAGGDVALNLVLAAANEKKLLPYEGLLALVSFRLLEAPVGAPFRDAITGKDRLRKPTDFRHHSYPLQLEQDKAYYLGVTSEDEGPPPNLWLEDETGKWVFTGKRPKGGLRKAQTVNLKEEVYRAPRGGPHTLIVASREPRTYRLEARRLDSRNLEARLVPGKPTVPCKRFEVDCTKDSLYTISVQPEQLLDQMVLESREDLTLPAFLRATDLSKDKTSRLVALAEDTGKRWFVVVANDKTVGSKFAATVTEYKLLSAETGALDESRRLQSQGKYFKDHRIELTKGKTYCIDLKSKQFDTYLVVERPDGTLVGADDDGGEGLNSRLLFTPPQSGEYVLKVTTYAAGRTGDYELQVREQADVKQYSGALDDTADRYRPPSGYEGSFDADGQQTYLLQWRGEYAKVKVSGPDGQAVHDHGKDFGTFLGQLEKQHYKVHVTPGRATAALPVSRTAAFPRAETAKLVLYSFGPALLPAEPRPLGGRDDYYRMPDKGFEKPYPLRMQGGRYYVFQFLDAGQLLKAQLEDHKGNFVMSINNFSYYPPSKDSDYRLSFSYSALEASRYSPEAQALLQPPFPFTVQVETMGRPAFYERQLLELQRQVLDSRAPRSPRLTLQIDLAWSLCMLERWEQARGVLQGAPRKLLAGADRDRYDDTEARIAFHRGDFASAVRAWGRVPGSSSYFDHRNAERLESRRFYDEAKKRLSKP
jgi:hypothetical protein